jgi:hypothetical protein
VGALVGDHDGDLVGGRVGDLVGECVGELVGDRVGDLVGDRVVDSVGDHVGDLVGGLPTANRDPTLGLQAWVRGWLCWRDTFAAPREGHLQKVSCILDV